MLSEEIREYLKHVIEAQKNMQIAKTFSFSFPSPRVTRLIQLLQEDIRETINVLKSVKEEEEKENFKNGGTRFLFFSKNDE